MSKKNKIITVEQAKEALEKVASTANYKINPVQLRSFVGVLIENKQLKYVENQLSLFVEKATSVFFSTALALEIARIFEKYSHRDKAKKIAYKMLEMENSSYQKDTFIFLLNIARKTDNYAEIDELLQKNPQLKKINVFSALYEMVFYYAYKNDLDKVEELILNMLKSFKDNQAVLQTAKALAFKFGLSSKLEEFFSAAKKENVEFEGESDNIKSIQSDTYNTLLSENEKASNAIALVDLTNGISHEYGQPVTNIRFNIQYHLKKFEQSGNFLDKKIVEQCLLNVLKQTERISELNKRLSPATSTQGHITEFDFRELLKEVIKQEEIRLLAANIELKHANSSVLLFFDKTQMRQILSNLITNSIDSIVEKQSGNREFVGKIEISTEKDKKFKKQINIVCMDNGIGISETIRTRIFNPFYTTKPPDKGQGLGLYIIKNILLKYGGTIRLDAKYKAGAKFIVQIPKISASEK